MAKIAELSECNIAPDDQLKHFGWTAILRADAARSRPATNVGQRQSTASRVISPYTSFGGRSRLSFNVTM
jgi:hypothetical protein